MTRSNFDFIKILKIFIGLTIYKKNSGSHSKIMILYRFAEQFLNGLNKIKTFENIVLISI